jgi:hypothetical protein
MEVAPREVNDHLQGEGPQSLRVTTGEPTVTLVMLANGR